MGLCIVPEIYCLREAVNPELLGRQADAVAHYREALVLYRELDNSYEEATVLHHLGDVHAACGEFGEAREQWARALSCTRFRDARARRKQCAATSENDAGPAPSR